MEIIFIITVLATVSYLFYMFYMQNEAKNEREYEISISKSKYNESKQNTLNSKTELLKCIENIYGKIDAERVENGKIWIGMDSDLLLASWRRASEIKENFIRGNKIEKWYYNPYYNRLNNLHLKFEVTVENNKVIGWKDL